MVNKHKNLDDLLNSLDEEDIASLIEFIQNNKKKVDNPIKEAGGKVSRNKGRPNEFLKMKFNKKEQQQLEEDKKIDELLLKNYQMSSRDRPHAEKITVRCSVCGKEESVSPNLVYSTSRYRCNNCYQGK